jgi:hypothetical protein
MNHFSVDEILNLPDNKKRETLEKLLAELKNLKGKDKYGLYWDLNATTEGEETVIKEFSRRRILLQVLYGEQMVILTIKLK